MYKLAAWSCLTSLFVTKCLCATTVVINGTSSHSIPSTLYGQMFEDISHSGDGGLYAEMLQNRAFQHVTPNTAAALYAWTPINSAPIAVVADATPLSSALPNSLQLTIPAGTSGSVGFGNTGYWGIKLVSTWTYNASFYYKFPSASTFSGQVTIGLQTSGGTVVASKKVAIVGSQTTWKQISVNLTPSTTLASTANNFTVTVQGNGGAAQTINFAMFSLFPPTYNNRPNGLRVDIAEALVEMKPSFFRFPGGNNLEGETIAGRWQWNNTLGPLTDRPGRLGDWGYVNTDGLGLLEYLTFIEDAGMEPIMAVWSGLSLSGGGVVAEGSLAPYIQQAIDQINFVIGDASTSKPAALRASLGHPKPFVLNYVEIGNEDFFDATTYHNYRWPDFYGNLTAAFPQLKFIATTQAYSPVLTPAPPYYDLHVYQTPSWFASNSFYYDSFKRDGTHFFEGEYAVTSTNSSNLYGSVAQGRLLYPTMQGSVGEAAFMTGLERNADIVFAASYAPLLNNIASTQWTPDLISFDASTVYRSTSYYVQKLFSVNKGDLYLPSTLPTSTGTLFWSVTRNSTTNNVLIKIANTVSTAASLTFTLPYNTVATSGTAQVLTGQATSSNTPTTPALVVPVTSTITTGKSFNYTAPGYSVSVLMVHAV